jgi:hypothetical protein
MNTDMDRLDPAFDPRIADWLEADPDRAPREVLDTVLAAMPSVPQRRAIRVPWRFPTLITPTRAVLAAVIGALLIGSVLLLDQRPGQSNVGGSPPSPSAPASDSSTRSPSPSPTPLPKLSSTYVGTSLNPGRYQVVDFVAPFTITLPPGWMLDALSRTGVSFSSKTVQNAGIAILAMDGAKVYQNPCHPETSPKAFGTGADSLVAALSGIRDFEVANVQDVTIGPARGKSFEFGNGINTGAAGCSSNPMPFATRLKDGTDLALQIFGGESDRFWALEVGSTTFLIAITDTPAIVAASQPVFDSIEFTEPASN